MIIKTPGAAFEYEGVTYRIGDPIIGTPESEYEGLFGTITEIRDGEDKETENETPHLYCTFDPPVLPCEIKKLEKTFSDLYDQPKVLDDIVLDEVIMAPEMIEPLRSQRDCKQELKVYAVCEDWSVAEDCEGGCSVSLFTDLRDAKRKLDDLLRKEMEYGCIPNWADESNFTCESSEDSYECYLDGEYFESHYKIYIRTELIPVSDAVLNSLGKTYVDQCGLEDFADLVAEKEEVSPLTVNGVFERKCAFRRKRNGGRVMNTRIIYLYRDACNYKKLNSCVISGEMTVAQIAQIMDCLDGGEYFIPCQVGLPEERFDKLDPQEDHCWFELSAEGFELTGDPSDLPLTASQLVQNFLTAKDHWDDRWMKKEG